MAASMCEPQTPQSGRRWSRLSADRLLHLYGVACNAGELGGIPVCSTPAGLLVEADGIGRGVDAQGLNAKRSGFGNHSRIHRAAKTVSLFFGDDGDQPDDADIVAHVQPDDADRRVVVEQQEGRIALGAIVRMMLVIGDGVAVRRKQHGAAYVVHGAPFRRQAHAFQVVGHRIGPSFRANAAQ